MATDGGPESGEPGNMDVSSRIMCPHLMPASTLYLAADREQSACCCHLSGAEWPVSKHAKIERSALGSAA